MLQWCKTTACEARIGNATPEPYRAGWRSSQQRRNNMRLDQRTLPLADHNGTFLSYLDPDYAAKIIIMPGGLFSRLSKVSHSLNMRNDIPQTRYTP
jgi:hypothetical protein